MQVQSTQESALDDSQFPLLKAIFAPQSLEVLVSHLDEGKCLVMSGAENKFENLVTLDDIERRLNDGSNASIFAQVIKEGTRHSLVDSNTPWTPSALRKSAVTEELQAGNSIMLASSSQINQALARLCFELESLFSDASMHADVHLYVSVDERGNSYDAHRDRPQHKLLLQAVGETEWQLFDAKEELADHVSAVPSEDQDKLLEETAAFTLKQGDLLYMPPGTFHKVSSTPGPRISISIPFFSMPEASRMDRSHIPFAQLFSS